MHRRVARGAGRSRTPRHRAPTQFTFALTAVPKLLLLRVAALSPPCARFMSILFCVTMNGTERLMVSRIPKQAAHRRRWRDRGRATLLVGTGDYNGAGMDVITRAIEGGQAAPDAFFLKAAVHCRHHRQRVQGAARSCRRFSSAPRSAACSAGCLVFRPDCRGARARVRVLRRGQLPDRVDGAEHRALRRRASSCISRSHAALPICSGYFGLYSSQKILYSKLRTEFINIHAK